MGSVSVNREAVHAAYRRDVVPDWQEDVGRLGQSAIGAAMPVVTGFMVTALKHEPITHPNGDPGIRWTGRADYTDFVDQGTGLYGSLHRPITPRTKKALSWIGANGRVTARSVKGQPGQHFFATGLRAIFGRYIERSR